MEKLGHLTINIFAHLILIFSHFYRKQQFINILQMHFGVWHIAIGY